MKVYNVAWNSNLGKYHKDIQNELLFKVVAKKEATLAKLGPNMKSCR